LHLEWVYEKSSTVDRTEQSAKRIKSLAIPPKKDLQALLEFAEINHITGLQKTIEKIKKSDKKFLSFAIKIEDLLDNFQFKEISNIIKSYIDKGK
jgi:hypothetical protein